MLFLILFFIHFFSVLYAAEDTTPHMFLGDANAVFVFNSDHDFLSKIETPAGNEFLFDPLRMVLDDENQKIYIANEADYDEDGIENKSFITILDLEELDPENPEASAQILRNTEDTTYFEDPRSLVLSTDGNTLYVGSDERIAIIDLVDLDVDNPDANITLIEDDVFDNVEDMCLSADGNTLFVLNEYGGTGGYGTLVIIDLSDNSFITLDNENEDPGDRLKYPKSLLLSQDGTKLFIVNQYGGTGGYGFLSIVTLADNSFDIINNDGGDRFYRPYDLVYEPNTENLFVLNKRGGSDGNGFISYRNESDVSSVNNVFSTIDNTDDDIFDSPIRIEVDGAGRIFVLSDDEAHITTIPVSLDDDVIVIGEPSTLDYIQFYEENNIARVETNTDMVFNPTNGKLYVLSEDEAAGDKGSLSAFATNEDGEPVIDGYQLIQNKLYCYDVRDIYYDEQTDTLFILNEGPSNRSFLSIFSYDADEDEFTFVKVIYVLNESHDNMVADHGQRKLFLVNREGKFTDEDEDAFVLVMSLDDYDDITLLSNSVNEDYEFNNSRCVAIDTVHNRLYVANEDNSHVTVLDSTDYSFVGLIDNGIFSGDLEEDDFDEPEWLVADPRNNRLYIVDASDNDNTDYIVVVDITDDNFTEVFVINNDTLRASSGIEDDDTDYVDDIQNAALDARNNRLYFTNEENDSITVVNTGDNNFPLVQKITNESLREASGIEDDETDYLDSPERMFIDEKNQNLYITQEDNGKFLVINLENDEFSPVAFIDHDDFEDPFIVFARGKFDIVSSEYSFTGDFYENDHYTFAENFVVIAEDLNLRITFSETLKLHKLALNENLRETTNLLGLITILNTETEVENTGTLESGLFIFDVDPDIQTLSPISGRIEWLDTDTNRQYILILENVIGDSEYSSTTAITSEISRLFVEVHTRKHRS